MSRRSNCKQTRKSDSLSGPIVMVTVGDGKISDRKSANQSARGTYYHSHRIKGSYYAGEYDMKSELGNQVDLTLQNFRYNKYIPEPVLNVERCRGSVICCQFTRYLRKSLYAYNNATITGRHFVA